VVVALLLLLALASQVGCDNGSNPGGGSSTGVVVQSTQTATQLEAMKQENNQPVQIAGLPAEMGTVSLK
jgi:hypothetical protein